MSFSSQHFLEITKIKTWKKQWETPRKKATVEAHKGNISRLPGSETFGDAGGCCDFY